MKKDLRMITLTCLNGGARFTCRYVEWLAWLDLAQNRGWSPAGTYIDFEYEYEQELDTCLMFTDRLFTTLHAHYVRITWDGNYTDPCGQVLKEEDADELYNALVNAGASSLMLEVIGNGSFRVEW